MTSISESIAISQYISPSISLHLPPSRSISLHLSPPLSLYLSLSISLPLSPSLSLYISLDLPLSPSISPPIPLSPIPGAAPHEAAAQSPAEAVGSAGNVSPRMPGRLPIERMISAPALARRGTNGVSTNGVTANLMFFLSEGLFGYSL